MILCYQVYWRSDNADKSLKRTNFTKQTKLWTSKLEIIPTSRVALERRTSLAVIV
jgi:hypothetical protein